MPWEKGDTLYRAVAHGYENAWVYYEEFEVVKVTPCGGWLERRYPADEIRPTDDGPQRTWRAFGTFFASPTKEEAKRRLVARTRCWVKHAKRRLVNAEARLSCLTEDEPRPNLGLSLDPLRSRFEY